MSEIRGLIVKIRLITETEGLGYKAFQFKPEATVEEALISIAKKLKMPEEKVLKEYHLFLPKDHSFLQGTELEPSQTLSFYEITSESNLEFKRKPNLTSGNAPAKNGPIHIETPEGKRDTFQMSLQEPAGNVLMYVCARYYYPNPMDYYLLREESDVKISPIHTLEEQGLQFNTVIRVKKRSKEDKKKQEKEAQKVMKEKATIIKQNKEKEIAELKAKEKQEAKIRISRKAAILRDGFDKLSNTVPLPLEELISWLEQNAMTYEGLFRIPGELTKVFKYTKIYKKKNYLFGNVKRPIIDFNKEKVPPNTVAGVLKMWIRELPEPIFTYELYSSFVSAARLETVGERIQCLYYGIEALPPGNKAICQRLFGFLSNLAKLSDKNKMNATNLAIIFAPSLLVPEGQPIHQMLMDAGATRLVMEYLIVYYNQIFMNAPREETVTRETKEFVNLLQIASDIAQEKLAKSREEDEKQAALIEEETEQNRAESEQAETAEPEETEISVNDLVMSLFEGNISGVEEYLLTLPPEKREDIRNVVWNEFSVQMKTRGFEDSSRTLSSRSGSKLIHQKTPSLGGSSGKGTSSTVVNWAVSCLVLGNTIALEQYLQTLPPEESEKIRSEVEATFESVVKKTTLRLMRSSYRKKSETLSSLPPPPKEEEVLPPLQDIDDDIPPPPTK